RSATSGRPFRSWKAPPTRSLEWMCLELHGYLFSLSSPASPAGGEGRGEEATSPSEDWPPPSPTLPPLVPRGERETSADYAKHLQPGKAALRRARFPACGFRRLSSRPMAVLPRCAPSA